MKTELSKSNLEELDNASTMDLIKITTNEGNIYKITLTNKIASSWRGMGFNINNSEDTVYNFELRYGLGADGDDDEPFIAIALAPEVNTEKIRKYLVVPEDENLDNFIYTHESGSVDYDEYAIDFEYIGQQELKIGEI